MSAWPILPDLLIAVLATWLEAMVATRAPRDDATRPFGVFALLLAVWSAARIVSRLSGDEGVRQAVGGVVAGTASLLPAVTLHLVLAFVAERRLWPGQRAALELTYALGLVVGVHAVVDREHPVAPEPPHWEVPGLAGSGVVVGWGWIVLRAAVLALAIGWAGQAWWSEGRGGARGDQLAAVLAAVMVGAAGGIGTILLADWRLADWPGMALIAVGLALATYAVFARRALLGPEVARRALSQSLGLGLLLVGFVAALLGLERLAQCFLALDLPLVAGLVLVLTVALFDPARERLRGLLDRRTERRDESYRRLLRALGDELAAPGRPEASLPHALGPLRVELRGERIKRWGGAKAGARQAEAMFAFLFDRGERGVGKDELLNIIWPDVPLDSADPAFHRTLGGLRRTLASAHVAGQAATITYYHDRYHLDPALIAWSDVAAFEEQVRAAQVAATTGTAIALLEGARALYRGDYLDDCPFYGDSDPVEDRRAVLRARHVDLQLALGERYEERGDSPAAAVCFREALRASGDNCPRAETGLTRRGLAA